jgi:hypothetical protein
VIADVPPVAKSIWKLQMELLAVITVEEKTIRVMLLF